jgi:hypothetical protein
MSKQKRNSEAIQLTPEELEFESNLENMLRSSGYLFPITPVQVDAYQKLKEYKKELKKSKKPNTGSNKKKKEDQ